jgi:hypothetical protein
MPTSTNGLIWNSTEQLTKDNPCALFALKLTIIIVQDRNQSSSSKLAFVQGNISTFQLLKNTINFLKFNREWLGVMSSLYLIHELVEHAYEFETLLEEIDFLVIPVANPDGYRYTHTTNRAWNKNRHVINANCVGVNLNANFRYQFLATSDVRQLIDNNQNKINLMIFLKK